jgi:hypothetical protein
MQETVSDPLSFGWYDSLWLRCYFDAVSIFQKVVPQRLREFQAAIGVFKTDRSYQTKYVSGILDRAALEEAQQVILSIPREKLEFDELAKFGRLVVHDWPAFTSMQNDFLDMVSDLAGEPLEPYYNFLSLYARRGVCQPHLDTPAAKWTFDLCIDQSDSWPINFTSVIDWPSSGDELIEQWRLVKEGRSGHDVQSLALMPGDALLFSGANQWHWRDPIPLAKGRSFCDLLFFHFIPKGTSELVRPINWARIFDVPELSEIRGIELIA